MDSTVKLLCLRKSEEVKNKGSTLEFPKHSVCCSEKFEHTQIYLAYSRMQEKFNFNKLDTVFIGSFIP